MKSINNIFEMVKADRYTADGREEIIKAQEAETQDARRYKTGEISEATGLQKQPDGSWAPPKKGAPAGAKQAAGIPKADEKTFVGKTYKDFAESARASGYTPKAEKENPDGSSSTTFENKEGKAIRVDFDKNGKISKVDAGAPEGEKQEEIGKFYTKFDDVQGAYDAGRQTFPEGGYTIFKTPTGQYKVVDDPKTKQRMTEAGYQVEVDVPEGTKPPKSPAPKRESVSAGRMQKDLDGNFWSRPDDFKEDITSRGWDVEEMNNEYAVISNEAGSQYEVRFNDHSDDGDLTVRTFKPLMVDEDDDDELEDAAPKVLTGDKKIKVKK